ncbi:hypothetical protein [uncultured Limimaricola sp.]|uniref:tetratricopeptide repeat protein n=1 Tax=uncultured Limimaricola sp. TaxID=2211667 RepID=UPI0030F7E673
MRIKVLLAPALLALGLAWPVAAQTVLDAAGLRARAVSEMAQGHVAQAETMARALLAHDPDDATALTLAAEGAVARGDWAAAQGFARRAHARVEGPARFRMARIAAFAFAKEGRFTRAQFWLRRAEPDAPDPEAAAGLARDYRMVAARNPLSFRLDFGVAPSSNVNGGSRVRTLTLPGLPFEFELSGDARALSGLAVSGSVQLGYTLPPLATGPVQIDLRATTRTYRLSDSARAQAPEARGSDFAQSMLSLGVNHRLLRGTGVPPIDLSVDLARAWYGGDPYSDSLRFGVARGVTLDTDRRLDLSLGLERVERRDIVAGWWTPSVGAVLRQRIGNDRLDLTAQLRDLRSDRPDTGHDSVSFGADYSFGRSFGPARLGLGIEGEWRDYDASRYAAGGREDRSLRLNARIGLPDHGRYGFYPEVGLSAERVWSQVDLFDEEAVTLDLSLRSAF